MEPASAIGLVISVTVGGGMTWFYRYACAKARAARIIAENAAAAQAKAKAAELKALDDKIIAMFTAHGLDPYKVMMRMREMIPAGE
jgi:hypothetical protein